MAANVGQISRARSQTAWNQAQDWQSRPSAPWQLVTQSGAARLARHDARPRVPRRGPEGLSGHRAYAAPKDVIARAAELLYGSAERK